MALWSALVTGSVLPSVGCQVEYAGMTLPSGRYMHDDVQYFPTGPDFPWANTQAASQRARMRAMGIEPPPPVGTAPVPPGALDATQMPLGAGGRMTNPNTQPGVLPPGAVPPPPVPGGGLLPGVPVPGAPAPAPGAPAPGVPAPGVPVPPPAGAVPPPGGTP